MTRDSATGHGVCAALDIPLINHNQSKCLHMTWAWSFLPALLAIMVFRVIYLQTESQTLLLLMRHLPLQLQVIIDAYNHSCANQNLMQQHPCTVDWQCNTQDGRTELRTSGII